MNRCSGTVMALGDAPVNQDEHAIGDGASFAHIVGHDYRGSPRFA